MGEKIIDPFNQLLNKINRELTRENLQSLVHICGKHVSAGEKEKIECGLDLFKYLQQRGIISHDKVGNLWKFMAKMLPQRADIVRLVNDYIKKEYHTNDERSVLQDLTESYEQFNNPAFSSSAPQDTNHEMKIDTECMYCVCRKPPSCYACLGFIGISVSIFIVVARGVATGGVQGVSHPPNVVLVGKRGPLSANFCSGSCQEKMSDRTP